MGVVPEAILPRPAVPLPPLDDLLGHVPVVKLESPLYVYSLAQEGEAGEQALPGRVQGLGVHRRGQSSSQTQEDRGWTQCGVLHSIPQTHHLLPLSFALSPFLKPQVPPCLWVGLLFPVPLPSLDCSRTDSGQTP